MMGGRGGIKREPDPKWERRSTSSDSGDAASSSSRSSDNKKPLVREDEILERTYDPIIVTVAQACPTEADRSRYIFQRAQNYYTTPEEGDAMMTCPYERSHRILKARFPVHMVRCRVQYLKMVERNRIKPEDVVEACTWNIYHYLPKKEMQKHHKECPSNPNSEYAKSQRAIKEQESENAKAHAIAKWQARLPEGYNEREYGLGWKDGVDKGQGLKRKYSDSDTDDDRDQSNLDCKIKRDEQRKRKKETKEERNRPPLNEEVWDQPNNFYE